MENNPEIWIQLSHDLATIIATTGAVIAAVSSLKNGQTLKRHDKDIKEVVRQANGKDRKKRTSKGDWYEPPELN